MGAQNRVQQMRSGPRLGPAGTPREGGDGDPGPDGPDGPGTSTTVPIADAVAGNGRPFEAAALESSGAQPHRDRPCRMCGGKKLWRLLPGSGRPDGGDLFCVSCQAPGPPADQIEFVEVAGA